MEMVGDCNSGSWIADCKSCAAKELAEDCKSRSPIVRDGTLRSREMPERDHCARAPLVLLPLHHATASHAREGSCVSGARCYCCYLFRILHLSCTWKYLRLR